MQKNSISFRGRNQIFFEKRIDIKGDPSLNEKSVINKNRKRLNILYQDSTAKSIVQKNEWRLYACTPFPQFPALFLFLSSRSSLLFSSSLFLFCSFGCVFKCVHVWRGWISRSRRGPSWIRPQIYHWVLFIEASMVLFEYEKKEPSEWFRWGASPGRNIGI